MSIYINKIVMLGDPAVGKTSLVHKFVNNMFDEKYLSTIGARPVKKEVQVNGNTVILIIWDIAGHNFNMHPAYYTGAKGALLVCDVTRRKTADSLPNWIAALKNKAGDVPVRVLANKSDLGEKEFDPLYVEDMGFDTMITSAKTGENVDKAFRELAEMTIRDKQ